jgi:hypothetical protein
MPLNNKDKSYSVSVPKRKCLRLPYFTSKNKNPKMYNLSSGEGL